MSHKEFFQSLTPEQMATFCSEEFTKLIETGFTTWEKLYAHAQKRK